VTQKEFGMVLERVDKKIDVLFDKVDENREAFTGFLITRADTCPLKKSRAGNLPRYAVYISAIGVLISFAMMLTKVIGLW
jgi:hypothetical protein